MDKRFARLSDADFRSYVCALAYAVESGTDGLLEVEDLPAIPRYRESSTRMLLAADLFRTTDDGLILIVDFETTQTTAAEVRAAEQRRVAERIRKRTQRARKRPSESTGEGGSSVSEAPPVTTWDVAPIPETVPLVEMGA